MRKGRKRRNKKGREQKIEKRQKIGRKKAKDQTMKSFLSLHSLIDFSLHSLTDFSLDSLIESTHLPE